MSASLLKIEEKTGIDDPLSLLLFNLVMELLLQKLQRLPGYKVGEENISVLAFAIFLVAKTAPEASILLEVAEIYLRRLGMNISVNKCACFVKTKDSWYLADPKLELRDGNGIPYASADIVLKYLGMKISLGRSGR